MSTEEQEQQIRRQYQSLKGIPLEKECTPCTNMANMNDMTNIDLE